MPTPAYDGMGVGRVECHLLRWVATLVMFTTGPIMREEITLVTASITGMIEIDPGS